MWRRTLTVLPFLGLPLSVAGKNHAAPNHGAEVQLTTPDRGSRDLHNHTLCGATTPCNEVELRSSVKVLFCSSLQKLHFDLTCGIFSWFVARPGPVALSPRSLTCGWIRRSATAGQGPWHRDISTVHARSTVDPLLTSLSEWLELSVVTQFRQKLLQQARSCWHAARRKRPNYKVTGAMAGIAEHAAIDGVGFCSEMNARGLLESLSIRAMVGCPPPVDKDQSSVWLKEGTMYVQCRTNELVPAPCIQGPCDPTASMSMPLEYTGSIVKYSFHALARFLPTFGRIAV